MHSDEETTDGDGFVNQAFRRVTAMLTRTGGQFDPERRQEIATELFSMWNDPLVSIRRFGMLMALSVTIATLGMRDDSEAVVIGAMLIAPLMTPMLGIAVSVVMGWPDRLWRSAFLVAGATLGAVLLAFIIQSAFTAASAEIVLPSALQARTSPRLVDLGIALTAGAAGAFVQMRREALSALPGVAVAVALVPPLAGHRHVPRARRLLQCGWRRPSVSHEP